MELDLKEEVHTEININNNNFISINKNRNSITENLHECQYQHFHILLPPVQDILLCSKTKTQLNQQKPETGHSGSWSSCWFLRHMTLTSGGQKERWLGISSGIK